MLGCLTAGFYLLRIYNVQVATFAAAALNVAVAIAALWLANHAPQSADEPPAEKGPAPRDWAVYLTIAISGAGALGAEVVWTRLMGMLLGSTVYVFSIILAVFLVGIAIGSALGSWVANALAESGRARLALGWCQLLLVLGIGWTAMMITDSLPYWPVDPTLSPSNWYTFQLDIVRCLWAILPPTLLWGASFPLALAAAAKPGVDPARLVGGVYAANTLGAIAGALGASLILVPWIGSQDTQKLLLILSAASAWFVLAPRYREKSGGADAGRVGRDRGAGRAEDPADPARGDRVRPAHRDECRKGADPRGQGRAELVGGDFAMGGRRAANRRQRPRGGDQRALRHEAAADGRSPAAILHPNPRRVLGIGFGAGVSAGTFTRYASIDSITVCEIEPIIPPLSTKYFAKQDYDVLHNPKTRIVYDDARHYMMTSPEKYDIIASDPLDVFVKGTAALYTEEYFEAVKRHLNPGGMFTLYVPLYESDLRTVKSELATFFAAFPYSTIWANTVDGQGYDMVFMGHLDQPKIDIDAAEERLRRPEFAPVVESLREIGLPTVMDLFSTYTGQRADLGPWVADAEINRDRDLRLQYLGGWGINSNLADAIYREMLRYRRLSDHPFVGNQERVQKLLAYIAGAH